MPQAQASNFQISMRLLLLKFQACKGSSILWWQIAWLLSSCGCVLPDCSVFSRQWRWSSSDRLGHDVQSLWPHQRAETPLPNPHDGFAQCGFSLWDAQVELWQGPQPSDLHLGKLPKQLAGNLSVFTTQNWMQRYCPKAFLWCPRAESSEVQGKSLLRFRLRSSKIEKIEIFPASLASGGSVHCGFPLQSF